MPALLRRLELARPSADTKIKEILDGYTSTYLVLSGLPARPLLPASERILGAEHCGTMATRRNLARFTGEAGNAARLAGSPPSDCHLRTGAGRRAPCTLTARHNHTRFTRQAGIRLLTRADRTSRDAEASSDLIGRSTHKPIPGTNRMPFTEPATTSVPLPDFTPYRRQCACTS
jgi:hypothetical protein